jgi:hypothetical protein
MYLEDLVKFEDIPIQYNYMNDNDNLLQNTLIESSSSSDSNICPVIKNTCILKLSEFPVIFKAQDIMVKSFNIR